jgi:hypothetical protein
MTEEDVGPLTDTKDTMEWVVLLVTNESIDCWTTWDGSQDVIWNEDGIETSGAYCATRKAA